MFKCFRQIEHSDCGLTCIRMIAKSYGLHISMRHLHGISDLNRLGMSIKDITSCCQKIGLDSAAVQIYPEHIEHMPLPAILFWQQRHFVVLYKYNHEKKKYYVADPAQGKLIYSEVEFLKYWIPDGKNTGLAVLAEPNGQFYSQHYQKENDLKNFFVYLSHFFKTYRAKFILALLITIAIMASDYAVPLLLKKTIDEGIGLKDVNLIVLLLLGQLSISIGGLVASSSMDLILTRMGLGIHLEMVNTFLERLSRFPLSFFDKKVSSDFVQKISDQSRIKDFLLTFPNSMLITVLTIIVFSTLLFHYSILIFIMFMIMSFLEIIWNTFFLNKRKTLDYAYFTYSAENR